MPWLEAHPTSGHFKICFRFNGRKLKKTVKTVDRGKADAALARFQENLDLLERGRIELPVGADVGTFLLSDGKPTGKPAAEPPPPALTLGGLRDAYLEVHSNGAMEANMETRYDYCSHVDARRRERNENISTRKGYGG